MLEQSTSIWVFLAGVSYVVVGIYLLRKPSTAPGRPEFYLGLAFLFDALSYGIGDLPYLIDVTSLFDELSYIGRISGGACSLAIAVFTLRCFWPARRWARRLVWTIAALIASGLAVSLVEGDLAGVAPLRCRGFWLDWLGGMAPFLWLAVESSRQYFTTARRASLGLIDPLVRNRYLLIAVYASFGTLIYVTYVPMYIVYELHGTWSLGLDLATAIAETVSVLALWLSFAAPACYRRRIGVTGAAASAER